MDELCDDLLLLCARNDGRLAIPSNLFFGLSVAELVRLGAAGRVSITQDRITALGTEPTGDPLLDEALASMAGGRREPTASAWVVRKRKGHVERYLARAEAAGAVRAERGAFRVRLVADAARAARARARLEAAAASTGPVDPEQAALACVACAVGLDRAFFPTRNGRPARERLSQLAKGDPVAASVTEAVAAAHSAAAAKTMMAGAASAAAAANAAAGAVAMLSG